MRAAYPAPLGGSAARPVRKAGLPELLSYGVLFNFAGHRKDCDSPKEPRDHDWDSAVIAASTIAARKWVCRSVRAVDRVRAPRQPPSASATPRLRRQRPAAVAEGLLLTGGGARTDHRRMSHETGGEPQSENRMELTRPGAEMSW